MAWLTINYDDGDANSYRNIELTFEDNTEKIFNTGDFVQDWYDYKKYIIFSDIEERIGYSSSVDHFIMDSKKYKSKYLHKMSTDENGKEVWDLLDDWNEGRTEFFLKVDENLNWKQLKSRCERKNKIKRILNE